MAELTRAHQIRKSLLPKQLQIMKIAFANHGYSCSIAVQVLIAMLFFRLYLANELMPHSS